MTLAENSHLSELRRLFDDRRRSERDLTPKRVVRRDRDGTTLYVPLTGKGCELRGGITPYPTGTVANTPASPDFETRGLAYSRPDVLTATSGGLWVERLEPRALYRGESVTVIAHGRIFTPRVFSGFGFRRSRHLNQDVTITDLRILDNERFEVDVTVAPGARLIEGGNFHYDDSLEVDPLETPTQMALRLTNAYDIIARNAHLPVMIGFEFKATLWTAYDLDVDGNVVEVRSTLDVTGLGWSEPDGGSASLIRGLGGIGYGSLAWRDGDATLRIWDTAADEVFSYAAAPGRWITAPIEGEKLYWVEMKNDVPQWDLMEIEHVDGLAEPDVRTTVYPDPAFTGFAFSWAPKMIATLPDGIMAAGFWVTLDFEEGVSTALLPYAGAGTVDDDNDPIGSSEAEQRAILRLAGPLAYGAIIDTTGDSDGRTISRFEQSVSGSVVSEWPDTGAWEHLEVYNSDVLGDTALLYADRVGFGDVVYLSAIEEQYGAAPDLTLIMAAQPELSLVFLGGGG